MKKARDSEQTRARIVAQATKLFARHGYARASTTEIVAAANVNQRMLYHYFGSKKGLYRAIFEEQWGQLRSCFEKALGVDAEMEELGPAALLREGLKIFSDFAAANQEFIRILIWEGLEGGAVSRSLWKGSRRPVFELVEAQIKHAQGQGLLDPRIDPSHLIISLLGAIGIYFAHQSVLKDLLPGQDPLSPKALERRKDQLDLLLTALAPRSLA